MSHLEDLAKSMGISSDELFSGKYGDSYDEILDNLMTKKLNRESYASEVTAQDIVNKLNSNLSGDYYPKTTGNIMNLEDLGDGNVRFTYSGGVIDDETKKMFETSGFRINNVRNIMDSGHLDAEGKITESYANEDLDLEKKDCQLCNFTVVWKKGDDWQKEDAEREFKEHQNNKHGIVESKASEGGMWQELTSFQEDLINQWMNSTGSKDANNIPNDLWEELISDPDGSYNLQIDDVQRYIDYKTGNIEIYESYASEMGDVLIDDTPYGFMEPDNPNSPMGDWTTLYGTSYTDGRQTIVDVPDDEEKAFTDILEQEGYDWIPEKGYYGFKKFEKEAKASEGVSSEIQRVLEKVDAGDFGRGINKRDIQEYDKKPLKDAMALGLIIADDEYDPYDYGREEGYITFKLTPEGINLARDENKSYFGKAQSSAYIHADKDTRDQQFFGSYPQFDMGEKNQYGHFGKVYGESVSNKSKASEDSLIKIEDDDDKDTKVTVLDEWENETDPDVGGDVEGLDQDQKDLSESWSKKSFNQKVEALEAVGFRQGKALRFASLAFEDFSKELQEAIDSVTQEDAEDEQEFIEQTREDEEKAGLVEVDYNNIGESRTARSKYECEFCNCGFKSNESLTIHYNDLHAIPPAQIDGYENWKEVADDLYKKELAKLKKRGRESVAGEKERAEWSWLVDKDADGEENESTESLSDDNKDVLRNWVKQNPYWTSIDDLPNEIFVSLMQKFGDDTDKRVEAQSEIINFMKSVSSESYANEDDYKYDFKDLTSLAQDKIESSGVSQSKWDSTPEEERKELEKEIREAYNQSDLVCPECGDITKDDKEFDDHLSAHRFDDGDY